MITSEVHAAALFADTDRCDRCPAEASTRVVLTGGEELVFCDHHLRRYRTGLAPVAVRFERHVPLDEALAFVPSTREEVAP